MALVSIDLAFRIHTGLGQKMIGQPLVTSTKTLEHTYKIAGQAYKNRGQSSPHNHVVTNDPRMAVWPPHAHK